MRSREKKAKIVMPYLSMAFSKNLAAHVTQDEKLFYQ